MSAWTQFVGIISVTTFDSKESRKDILKNVLLHAPEGSEGKINGSLTSDRRDTTNIVINSGLRDFNYVNRDLDRSSYAVSRWIKKVKEIYPSTEFSLTVNYNDEIIEVYFDSYNKNIETVYINSGRIAPSRKKRKKVVA